MDNGDSRKLALLILILLVLAVPQEAFANSAGKIGSSSTGCGGGSCHGSTNTVSPSLTGLPSSGYTPGSTYTLTIGGSGGPSGTQGGFNLDASHGGLSNPGQNTQILNGEATHSNSAARSWIVDWTSPSAGTGDVTFYLAVNFVNGNTAPSGDAWGYNSHNVSESTSTAVNWTLNQPGSDRGSVFSHSILDLDSESPTLVLSNGTLVTFSSGTGGGNPVYTSDEVTSMSGDCAILRNLSLRCRGVNDYGQLGLGSNSLTNGTVDFGNRVAIAISNGNNHNCAILDDASVRCWGRNNLGQLGDGSNINRNTPVSVNLGLNRTAVAISASIDFTCALLDNSDIKCWGDNSYGIMADGTTNDSNTPVTVNHSAGMRAVAIATPGYSVCSLFENGSVRCWGKSYTITTADGTVANGSEHINFATGRTAVEIDGTAWHTCAILDNGSMNCWGVNTHGQWGNGECSSVASSSGCTGQDGNTPVHVRLSGSAIAIVAGTESSCALIADYSLQCWGAQTGEFDGTNDDITIPHSMNFSSGADIAFSDQDMDGDGTWNSLDTHMTGDDDGDGTPSPSDPYPSNPARWMDCPAGKWGRISCTDSDPGHYSSSGALYHSQCQVGTYQPDSGQETCHLSSAGNIVTSAAATSQDQCISGSYQVNLGQTSCTPTSPGNYSSKSEGDAPSNGTFPTNLSPRSATYTGSIQAPSGSDYQDMFAIEIPRDYGLSVRLTSMSSSNFILELFDRNYSVLNSSNTSASYAEVSTNNTGYSNGSTLYISIREDTGTGDYQMQVWLFSLPDGELLGNPSFSIEAEIGVRQYQCSPGTYQSISGQSSCDDASPGHYVSTNGSTSQNQCSPGTYQPYWGQASCLSSTPGNYVSGYAATSQTPASPGHYVNSTGATEDVACMAGTFQPSSGQTSCLDADPGHYVASTGQSTQTPCSPGTYQPGSGQASCLDADPGHYVSISGATSQTMCSPGSYQPNSAQSSCNWASVGHYVFNYAATAQTPCSKGTYQPTTGQISCLDASPGHYVNTTGSGSQTQCTPGNYQPLSGQHKCDLASPGHYVDSYAATDQTPCLSGTYNPSNGSTSSDACLSADPGNSVPDAGSSHQTPCTAGHYQPNSGESSCTEADAGYYVGGSGSIEQTPCDPGRWQNQTGKGWCWEAEPGHYVDSTASTSQTPCAAGTYNPNYGSNSSADCIAADPGYHVPAEGSINQEACPAGTYQNQTGQSACNESEAGHYTDSTASLQQSECLAGTYQPLTGQFSCLNASAGHYVETSGSAVQQPCPSGHYNPDIGADSLSDCLPADPGWYVGINGSTSQTPCALGTYQPNTGQSACLESDPGYFVASIASTTQSACPAGTYNPSMSSDSGVDCLPADSGNYVDVQASPSQTPCSPGTYQPDLGQVSCPNTEPGHYAPDEGQSEQIPAPLGTYVTNPGSTAFEHCPEGHVTIQLGAVSEDDCFLDSDGDGLHDLSDFDDDGDGIDDIVDMCPLGLMGWSSSATNDNDADGCNDEAEDSDDDNDGFPDESDALPLDSSEWEDNDMDGLGNNEDPDDDNDGLSDSEEEEIATDPMDSDTDDDGFSDSVDAFPKDPTEWSDTDGDGYGDNGDAFPNDASKHLEEDLIAKYGLVIGLLTVLLVIGLGGWMVMRRKTESSVSEAAEHTMSVETPSQPSHQIEPAPQFEPQPTVGDEADTDSFLEELEADLQRPTAPSHAKMNEQGQLVWVDESGKVFAQNPDGSMLTFDVSTGSWKPLD